MKRKSTISNSEIITILYASHCGNFTNFKHFYTQHIQVYFNDYFPTLVSYNQFIVFFKFMAIPIRMFLKLKCFGTANGINFIDSTDLKVSLEIRIHNRQVFKNVVEVGYCSIG